MITKNKTKSGSSALVISMMCAVIMTIIRQSINNHSDTYAGIAHTSTEIGSQKTHGIAPAYVSSSLGSSDVLDDITSLIIHQKEIVDRYLAGVQLNIPQDNVVHNTTVIQTGKIVGTQTQPILPSVSEYMSFENIKKSLSNRKCEYVLPIDSTDPKTASHIQWGLEHCLITVSAAQKVYPNDILTHEMMRMIAQRVGFVVKMDYASHKPVSREQFLSFFYALQQHHQIGDLPVVSLSSPLRRSEYIIFLHKILGDLVPMPLFLTGSVTTGTTITIPSQSSQFSGASIGIDKEMMKQTLSRFIQQL